MEDKAKVAFILDGGPKVASCVINEKLYNLAPSGWKFFSRDFGEIGGDVTFELSYARTNVSFR